MATDNYFKICGVLPLSQFGESTSLRVEGIVFFDGASLDGTIEAWRSAATAANSVGGTISMFRPPKHRGQWDQVAAVVGHRHLDCIEADIIESLGDSRENAALTEELNQLQDRWRHNKPTASVTDWEDEL